MSKVLIIGSGGREHALAWKFARSPLVDRVYAAPGSACMENIAELVDIGINDFVGLAAFVKSECISLTVVGPEVPLAGGIADYFKEEDLMIFGPDKSAAIIESSKSFAKNLMKKYNIPTAAHETFDDYQAAAAYIASKKPPYVLKADGLAEGKGVFISETKENALRALEDIMVNKRFGDSGKSVVIEEFLEGIEFSYMAFVHGEKVFPMIAAKDHKRAFDDDKGPNTGGMGAYAPVPQISAEVLAEAREKILFPTAKAMVKEGRPFTGVLFAGLISTSEGPKVIEFNARFGDPEAEVVLPLLESDLYTVITDILADKTPTLTWNKDHMLGIVMASKGYPEKYETGFPISGFEDLDADTYLFHCGTARDENGYVTKGGRVLFVARKAGSLYAAREPLYKEASKIKCENLYYRRDIGGFNEAALQR